MPWYVLYTKSQNERKTASSLEKQGIEVYCPVRNSVRQWSDRKKTIIEPVFKSYIFVNLNDYKKEQTNVLMTPGAVRFLWWLGKPGVVRNEEIEAIRAFLEDYKHSQIEILTEGSKVIINEGVLMAQKGTVVKIRGAEAILSVSSLGWQMIAKLPLRSISMDK